MLEHRKDANDIANRLLRRKDFIFDKINNHYRHCEERSDEAISSTITTPSLAENLRFSCALNIHSA